MFEVGPAKHGPTVIVTGRNPLQQGKKLLREQGKFTQACGASFRFKPERLDTRIIRGDVESSAASVVG